MNINKINNESNLSRSSNKVKDLLKNISIKNIRDSFKKIDKDFADKLKAKLSLSDLIDPASRII
ncbi:MAG: hypothetical protein ACP5RD_01050 [bacterium]